MFEVLPGERYSVLAGPFRDFVRTQQLAGYLSTGARIAGNTGVFVAGTMLAHLQVLHE